MIWHPYEQNWTSPILENTLFLSFCKMLFARKFEGLTQKLVYKSSCKVDKPPKETLHKFISPIQGATAHVRGQTYLLLFLPWSIELRKVIARFIANAICVEIDPCKKN